METKYNDIYVPNLDEPAELEQYIRDLMTKVDKTMHDIELCVDTRLPKPIIKELTRLRCELIAVMTEVRKMGCIVHADQKSVGEMLLRVKRVEIKVDELNKELDALKVDVEKNTEHLKEHDSTLDAHEDKLTTYKRYLDRHKEQISELRADLTKCTDDLKALTDRVDTHAAILDEHQTTIGVHDQILTEHGSAIETLNRGIGELDNRCSTVEQKVDTLEECCGEVKDTLVTMNHGIGELDKRTTQNEEDIAENAKNIEENLHKIQQILGVESAEGITSISVLQKLVDQFTNQVTENTENITNITNRVDTNEQNISDNTEKITDLTERTETNEQDISNLKTASDELREDADNLREDVDKNTVDIGDINTEVEQLTQSITNVNTKVDELGEGGSKATVTRQNNPNNLTKIEFISSSSTLTSTDIQGDNCFSFKCKYAQEDSTFFGFNIVEFNPYFMANNFFELNLSNKNFTEIRLYVSPAFAFFPCLCSYFNQLCYCEHVYNGGNEYISIKKVGGGSIIMAYNQNYYFQMMSSF